MNITSIKYGIYGGLAGGVVFVPTALREPTV